MTERDIQDDIKWSRRRFLAGVGVAGVVTGANLLVGCGGSGSKAATTNDGAILNAAATAEALEAVMYDQLIKSALYTNNLSTNANDQAYLVAGRVEEGIHYQTLTGLGATALALTFYFPVGMFTTTHGTQSLQTTLNTLLTLEETGIAAYLLAVGPNGFAETNYKVLAAQIMGIESEHRALGRVIAADVGLTTVTGLSGSPDSVQSPQHAVNNIAFEQTFNTTGPRFNTIADVVTALGPFVTAPTVGAAGAFDPTPYQFNTTSGFYLTEAPTVTLDNTTPVT